MVQGRELQGNNTRTRTDVGRWGGLTFGAAGCPRAQKVLDVLVVARELLQIVHAPVAELAPLLVVGLLMRTVPWVVLKLHGG